MDYNFKTIAILFDNKYGARTSPQHDIKREFRRLEIWIFQILNENKRI